MRHGRRLGGKSVTCFHCSPEQLVAVSSLPQQGPEPTPAASRKREGGQGLDSNSSRLHTSGISSSGGSSGSGQAPHSDGTAVDCNCSAAAPPDAFGDQYLALCLAVKVRDALHAWLLDSASTTVGHIQRPDLMSPSPITGSGLPFHDLRCIAQLQDQHQDIREWIAHHQTVGVGERSPPATSSVTLVSTSALCHIACHTLTICNPTSRPLMHFQPAVDPGWFVAMRQLRLHSVLRRQVLHL